ncbi:MAG: AarF/ABC1/UbiB kinase family protein [Thermodesulfobacteriota bacterium]
MKLSTLTQFSSNAPRFKEIVSTIARYGLANWIHENDPQFIRGLLKSSKGDPITDMSPEARLRLALTELGTTFIKLGQILSTRADLIGPSMAAELTKLQANVPPDHEETVRQTLENELGQPLEKLFAEFDPKAMGSASIGQVHRARLHDGQTVVVKVQHAGIEPKVISDLEILKALAEMAERYDPDLRLYQPRATIGEFSRNLMRELDFRRELRSLKQFQQNFGDDDWIHIPEPFPEFSSQRVLTMELLAGFSIAKAERMAEEKIETQEFVHRGANMYLEMIFRDRFFHADPHPGNIWVLPDGKLGLLDCGMTGRLDSEMREELEGILLAAVDNDPDRLTDHVLRIATVPPSVDRNALRRDIDDFLSEYVNVPIDDLDLSAALNSLTEILRNHHIILPAGISLLVRVMVMLEGTSRLLDRNFSLAELIQPYAVESIRRRYSPGKLLQRAKDTYRDWDRVLKILPRELFDLLTRMREGRLDVSIEHRRLEKVVKWMVHGILSAALFMGGSMILSRAIPPLIGGISVIGAGTSLLGLILGYRLVRAMHKSGDL